MAMNLIQMAIPAFLILIALEWWLAPQFYKSKDAASNIGAGLIAESMSALVPIGLFGTYAWIQRNWGYRHWNSDSITTWVLAFLGVEFIYYWWHRANHSLNALWAMHVVHHQSEEYNLTVALRQNWLTDFTAGVSYLPLAFLGIPFEIFFTMKSVMLIYQFWIHTRTVKSLGFLEWILNTPSHHRVHHGTNPQYLDKNFGGTFIVFDLLFGTFKREVEPVRYGVTKPLGTFNPVWANLDYWAKIMTEMRSRTGFFNKCIAPFSHPLSIDHVRREPAK